MDQGAQIWALSPENQNPKARQGPALPSAWADAGDHQAGDTRPCGSSTTPVASSGTSRSCGHAGGVALGSGSSCGCCWKGLGKSSTSMCITKHLAQLPGKSHTVCVQHSGDPKASLGGWELQIKLISLDSSGFCWSLSSQLTLPRISHYFQSCPLSSEGKAAHELPKARSSADPALQLREGAWSGFQLMQLMVISKLTVTPPVCTKSSPKPGVQAGQCRCHQEHTG